MSLLKLTNINTYYDKIQALKGIDIEVEQGSIVTILGANGAGKTTMMNTIGACSRRKRNSSFNDGAGKLGNGCLSPK